MPLPSPPPWRMISQSPTFLLSSPQPHPPHRHRSRDLSSLLELRASLENQHRLDLEENQRFSEKASTAPDQCKTHTQSHMTVYSLFSFSIPSFQCEWVSGIGSDFYKTILYSFAIKKKEKKRKAFSIFCRQQLGRVPGPLTSNPSPLYSVVGARYPLPPRQKTSQRFQTNTN